MWTGAGNLSLVGGRRAFGIVTVEPGASQPPVIEIFLGGIVAAIRFGPPKELAIGFGLLLAICARTLLSDLTQIDDFGCHDWTGSRQVGATGVGQWLRA